MDEIEICFFKHNSKKIKTKSNIKTNQNKILRDEIRKYN